jgi:hypothetical protein
MKSRPAVSITPLYGQYYARWRSEELRINKHGKEVPKEYFEPTGVPVPEEGSPESDYEDAIRFATEVAEYMAELTSPRPPCAELQQTKLKAFAIKAAKASLDSIKNLVPSWLVDYATEKDGNGNCVKMCAVSTVVSTWHRVLEDLGHDRNLDPSVISTQRLQKIIDGLAGKQERHVINVRAAFNYGVKIRKVLKSQNPAEDLEIKYSESINRIPFPQLAIRRALSYMGKELEDGDQWQLVTLCGPYTPMRFLTACRLKLMPEGYIRPDDVSGPFAVLDTSSAEWKIEFYDTKGKKWEVQILDNTFVLWLKPYVKKHQLKPGDYLFPNLAGLANAPSTRWQEIVEKSGYKMLYSKNGQCRTGYHALRISLDKWLRENEQVALTQNDVNDSLRHSGPVHKGHYNSDALDILQQRKINAARPKFFPEGAELNEELLKVQEDKRKAQAALEHLCRQEAELQALVSQKHGA